MLRNLMQQALALAMVSAFLGGCAYHESQPYDINNPVVRKLGWFSYLDGHDIRESCAAGGQEHYRLVYNGQYDGQLRSYDLYVGKDGSGVLNARAIDNNANVFNIELANPFAPWSWKESQAKLTPAEVTEFRAVLAASGYGNPAPDGLQLHSQDFYWVAAGCKDGAFHYDAWNNRPQSMASAGFNQIKFRDFLLKHDQTGLAFRPDHVTTPLERQNRQGAGNRPNAPTGTFILYVKGEGLGGLLNAF